MDDLRPHTWNEYVGQEALKAKLDVYCRDAIARRHALPHVLLHAEPGFGKTSLAALLANRLNDPFHVVTLSPKYKPSALHQFFNSFARPNGGGVVLFDEFHRAPDGLQEEFLTALEDFYVTTANGRRVYLGWFTAIIATTQPEDVLATVKRRLPISNLTFDPYTDEELGRIVRRLGARIGVNITPKLAEGVGRAAGGRPGEAVPLVYAVRALSQDRRPTLQQVLDFCEVDEDGITKTHRRLLEAIDLLAGVGSVGLERLSSHTGLHPSIIRGLERLLTERDLITQGAGGRELTSSGVARIRGDVAAPRGFRARAS